MLRSPGNQGLCLLRMCSASGAQHGKEWQVSTAQELEGRSLAAAERLFHIQSQAVAARSVHDMFVEAFTAFALEVEEQPSEDNSSNPSVQLSIPTAAHIMYDMF